MTVPVSRYTFRDLLVMGAVLAVAAVLAWLLQWQWLGLICAALFLFLLFFFRDPARKVPQDPGVLVSPADGRIVQIERVDDCPLMPGGALKIGIFMSVFNVHVNRAPAAGTVNTLNHQPGKFYNALKARAATDNESNSMVLNCPAVPGQRVLVKQIAGVLARRIVCAPKLGEQLARGQTFGIIKFGSRVEVYLSYSDKLRLQVKKGQKVKAGLTILLRYDPVASSQEQAHGG